MTITRAHRPGELQAGQRDAAADADDEHRLAGLQRALAEQHAPGGEVAGHQRAGGHEVGGVGQGEEAVRRQRDVLGQRAVAVLADDVGVQAQRLVAGEAIAAAAAEGVGIEDGLLPDLQGDPVGHLRDHAGGLDALHQR